MWAVLVKFNNIDFLLISIILHFQINNVSKITNAASSGATVLMMQTDDIHESFYDLFNQHFRKIKVGTQKGEKQTHFFANVAIGSHSKPCRVNHEFQCLVIIKDSELAVTPAPFLNRFEKYRLSTTCFLDASLNLLPPLLKKTVEDAKNKTWLPKDAQISRSQVLFLYLYSVMLNMRTCNFPNSAKTFC